MTSVSLVAVGDVSFGDHPVCASFGVDSMLRKRPNLDVFGNVKERLKGHDIVFANLETVFGSDEDLGSAGFQSMHMRGRPASITQLVNAGFNVVNIANNHILQHGRSAFEETIKLLRSAGILPVGLAAPNGANCQPARLVIRGTEVVFLGYAFERDRYHRGAPLYAQAEYLAIVDDIRRAKTNNNIVICSFHWGREYISYPSLEQIAIARGAIDAGCDVIVGHHPHVLNGYERYKGKYIFYSLGNFVFDQLWNDDCTMSMAVHVLVSPGEVQFTGADGIRIGSDYRPALIRDRDFDETLERLCSEIKNTIREEGKGYAREARRREARNRYRSWLYLLRHVHRYDPAVLKLIIAEAVSRRVRGFRDGGSPGEPVSGS